MVERVKQYHADSQAETYRSSRTSDERGARTSAETPVFMVALVRALAEYVLFLSKKIKKVQKNEYSEQILN
jgi:hypothetical protein